MLDVVSVATATYGGQEEQRPSKAPALLLEATPALVSITRRLSLVAQRSTHTPI